MATLSTSAWVLHDLGLAAGFGGSLFGQLALHPALKDIRSEEERGMVMHDAWANYNVVTGVSLGVAALTWFFGRGFISGRSIDKTSKALVIAKDVLVGASIATGIANIVMNEQMGSVPVRGAAEPSERTPDKSKRFQKILSISGPVNVGLIAATLGITTILAMRSGKSSKWAAISRFLP